MKSLVLLLIALFAAKKAVELLLTLFCVLLVGYGSYVLLRGLAVPGSARSDAPSLMPYGSVGDYRGSHLPVSLAR